MTNRRNFLKKAGLGVASANIPGLANTSFIKEGGVSKAGPDIKLGVASFTLKNFSQEDALNMTKRCGGDRITFKSMQL